MYADIFFENESLINKTKKSFDLKNYDFEFFKLKINFKITQITIKN